MTTDRAAMGAGGSPRQKIMIGVVVVVVGVLAWQMFGLFSGGGSSSNTPAPGTAMPAMPSPQPAALVSAGATKDAPLTPREEQLMKLQEETEAKYIAAVNELQMLKVQKDIAETNKAIVTAKLDTVTAQKSMVDLLAPPAPPQPSQADYAKNLAAGQGGEATPSTAPGGTATTTAPTYTVISVSHLQGRWNAVVGYQGKLLNLYVGDVLPGDGSTVIAISKSGITLRATDGTTKKISLVSII